MEFSFETDEETLRLFEIVVYFLERYFNYDEPTAIHMVNQYHETWKHIHRDDDYYHHEGAFHVAVRVHYFIGLVADEQSFTQWRLENGYMTPPREAIDYFNDHYFE